MSTLKASISTPVKSIHDGEDIVDSQGNLVCVMADKHIDSNQIVSALNEQAELNVVAEKALQLLHKHGICDKCGEFFEHHYDEPFASCSCGTSEWYELTPHMKLRQQLNDATYAAKLSQLDSSQRVLLNEMLENGIIERSFVINRDINELIDEIVEYALK